MTSRATPVRFTKEEGVWLRAWVQAAADADGPKDRRLADAVLDKLEKSELGLKKRKPEPGIGWWRASVVMRGILGPRLAVAPNPSEAWQGRMSARIRDLGLTEGHCERLARFALENWRGPVSFENLLRGADRYLTDAPVPTKGLAGPLEVDDS